MQESSDTSKIFIAHVLLTEAYFLISDISIIDENLKLKHKNGLFTKMGKELASARTKLENVLDRISPKGDVDGLSSDFSNFLGKQATTFTERLINAHLEDIEIENSTDEKVV